MNFLQGVLLIACCVLAAVQAKNIADDAAESHIEAKGVRVIIEGEEYFIGRDALAVWQAYRECAAQVGNMTLVSLDNQAKNELIKNWLAVNGYGGILYWTGGCRVGSTAVWQWTPLNEQVMTYTDWNIFAGEPDYNVEAQDACMRFGPTTGWFDESCFDKVAYICEHRRATKK